MDNTNLSIQGESFLINGKPTYAEIDGSRPEAHGLLMNARFIQGVLDDKSDPSRYSKWGRGDFDPETNTDNLIAALPEWHAHGLRAFTVGFQGGGPCATVPNRSAMEVNPFGADGKRLEKATANRMERLIRAADKLGMVVIVSYFYPAQIRRLKDDDAVRNAVITASRWLHTIGGSNVIIEPANEHNLQPYSARPVVHTAEGMASLLRLAQEESAGMPVGCSGGGSYINRTVADASDVILVHGNGCTRQRIHQMIQEMRSWKLNKPIVFNEDSQAIGNMRVTYNERASWGYYNNNTKQEPPTDWTITRGEDQFFARRMAEGIGIELPPLSEEERHYLQGLEPGAEYEGQRWVRLASLYPETVDYVEFYRNGDLYDRAYVEPYLTNYKTTWLQGSAPSRRGDVWKAVVHLAAGGSIERTAEVP